MSRNRVFCVAAVLFAVLRSACHSESSHGSHRDDRDQAEEATEDIDRRLVGAWRHTDAYASGDFTAAVDDRLWLAEDGAYREGGAAAAGDSGSSLVDREEDRADGAWKCEDKILYLKPEGGDWIAVARYSVDESHLLLRYSNGSQKIWERM